MQHQNHTTMGFPNENRAAYIGVNENDDVQFGTDSPELLSASTKSSSSTVSAGSGDIGIGIDKKPASTNRRRGRGKAKGKHFPRILRAILSKPEYADITSWHPNGRCFIIHDPKAFASRILPEHFGKEVIFRSFTRKLNRWGFRSAKKHNAVFAPGEHETAYEHIQGLFLRDLPELARMITCNTRGMAMAAAEAITLQQCANSGGTAFAGIGFPNEAIAPREFDAMRSLATGDGLMGGQSEFDAMRSLATDDGLMGGQAFAHAAPGDPRGWPQANYGYGFGVHDFNAAHGRTLAYDPSAGPVANYHGRDIEARAGHSGDVVSPSGILGAPPAASRETSVQSRDELMLREMQRRRPAFAAISAAQAGRRLNDFGPDGMSRSEMILQEMRRRNPAFVAASAAKVDARTARREGMQRVSAPLAHQPVIDDDDTLIPQAVISAVKDDPEATSRANGLDGHAPDATSKEEIMAELKNELAMRETQQQDRQQAIIQLLDNTPISNSDLVSRYIAEKLRRLMKQRQSGGY